MNDARVWAILVATQHRGNSDSVLSEETRIRETHQLISRAKSVANPGTTCALVDPEFAGEWAALATDLPPRNIFLQSGDTPAIEGVSRVLRAIRARDVNASVILIPGDHCAAVESAWVLSARGALTLARDHLDTVYLLHDKAAQEDRPFDASLDFCSSTVIVGSAVSLLDLSEGKKETKVLDWMAEDLASSAASDPVHPSDAGQHPINLVHVRHVEEYARIQRGHYRFPASTRVDVVA
jgi:hypothetical protein